MAILFLIGKNHEPPTIIKELLNVEKHKAKPAYEMALDLPLVLYECGFDNLDFIYLHEKMDRISEPFTEIFKKHFIKSSVANLFKTKLDALFVPPAELKKKKTYRPLLDHQ